MNEDMAIKFGIWLSGHDEETIKQMLKDYLKTNQF